MLARVARKRIDRGHGHKHQEMDGKMPPGKALEAVPRFDLRTAVGGQQSSQSLGCSKPLVAGVVVHVVLNEHMASGGVRNHFVKASLDPSLSGSAGGGGADSGWRAWSWCSTGTRPIRAIHGLDDECHTLIYTQGGRFRFATGPAEQRGNPSSSSNNAAGMAIGGGFPGMAGTGAGSGGVAALGGAGGGGGGGGGVGAIFESLPVHSGSIVDFRVNPFSRDIVSGCDHGHAHVLNFSPDMVGVPTMKVSKYVAQPLSSARWGKGSPYMASWTSSKGLLQMLDTRDYRMVSSTQVEGGLVHTHEYISDMVLAVGCGVGCVQLFDVRKMEAFVTLEDTVAGSIHQILSSTGGDSLYAGAASPSPSSSSSGVKDWVALGTAGVSRYSVGSEAGNTNGSSASAGAGAGVSPGDGDELVRFTARMSYAAGCRIVDLNLPIGLDMNAGLFVIPPHSSEPQQLCGITVDSRIVAFTSPSPSPASGGGGGGGGGVGANGSTAPTFSKQTAVGMDVGNAAGSGSGSGPGPSSLRAMSPVAPVDGSTVAGSGGGHGTGGIDAGAGGGGGGGEISKSAAVTAADGFGRAGEEGSVGTRPAAGKPLGFDLSEREVKRAGLDHWSHVDLRVHESWRCFTDSMLPLLGHDRTGTDAGIFLVSKRLKLGSTPIADVDFFPRRPSLPATPAKQSASGVGPGEAIDRKEEGGGGSSDGGAGGRLDLPSTMRDSGGGGGGGSGCDVPGDNVALVFGNEVDGLSALEEGPQGRSLPAVYLPMRDDVIRSYNLSNAVAMAVYEVDRQRRESRRRNGVVARE